MIPVKDAQLRGIGACDTEIDSFMRAAGAAAYAALDGADLLWVLNGRNVSIPFAARRFRRRPAAI
jgi:hypothetical protein